MLPKLLHPHWPLGAAGPSVPSDPSPLVPDYLEPYIGRFANASGCAEAIARQPEPSSSVYWRAASAGAYNSQAMHMPGRRQHMQKAIGREMHA